MSRARDQTIGWDKVARNNNLIYTTKYDMAVSYLLLKSF
jgi:hypothetical protein